MQANLLLDSLSSCSAWLYFCKTENQIRPRILGLRAILPKQTESNVHRIILFLQMCIFYMHCNTKCNMYLIKGCHWPRSNHSLIMLIAHKKLMQKFACKLRTKFIFILICINNIYPDFARNPKNKKKLWPTLVFITRLNSCVVFRHTPITHLNSCVVFRHTPITHLNSCVVFRHTPIIHLNSCVVFRHTPITHLNSCVVFRHTPITHLNSCVVFRHTPITHQLFVCWIPIHSGWCRIITSFLTPCKSRDAWCV